MQFKLRDSRPIEPPYLRGNTYVESDENLFTFYGNFANELVTLDVLASPETNNVFKVIVYFPEQDSWAKLRTDYFAKKTLYSSKYPLDIDFAFFSPPYENGDGYEMRAVSKEKFNYVSFFLAMGGYISVRIDNSARIRVVYEDREGAPAAKQELHQKAVDDI